MSRVLLYVSWIAGGVAWAALILLWRDLFLAAGITSAVATLAWGYCTEPDRDPDDWSADEWWGEGELEDAPVSAYGYERDEWRRAVAHSTEAELAAACGHTSRQHGVCTDCGHRPDREDL